MWDETTYAPSLFLRRGIFFVARILLMDNSDTNTTYAMITPILIKGKTPKQPKQ
jgi:hypothetical protein